MKTFLRIFLIFLSLLTIFACAAGNIQIPEKYALDEQLEKVSSIFKYGITGWEEVDNQSLILEKAPGEYYLVVLKIPASELPFRNRIKLSSTGDMIRAGLDEVIFYSGAHIKMSYPIERIYRIKGIEQMRVIRDQLTGETDPGQKDNKAGISGEVSDMGVEI